MPPIVVAKPVAKRTRTHSSLVKSPLFPANVFEPLIVSISTKAVAVSARRNAINLHGPAALGPRDYVVNGAPGTIAVVARHSPKLNDPRPTAPPVTLTDDRLVHRNVIVAVYFVAHDCVLSSKSLMASLTGRLTRRLYVGPAVALPLFLLLKNRLDLLAVLVMGVYPTDLATVVDRRLPDQPL